MGYGKYVGRIGALAVAMGIGVAAPAVAIADVGDVNTDTDASAGNAGTGSRATGSTGTKTGGGTAADTGSGSTSTDDSTDGGQVSGDSGTTGSQSTVSVGDSPTVVVRSTGGAQTSAGASDGAGGAKGGKSTTAADADDTGGADTTAGKHAATSDDKDRTRTASRTNGRDTLRDAVDRLVDPPKAGVSARTVASNATAPGATSDSPLLKVPAIASVTESLPVKAATTALVQAAAKQPAPAPAEAPTAATPVSTTVLRALGVLPPSGPEAPAGSPVLEMLWGLYRRTEAGVVDGKVPAQATPVVPADTAVTAKMAAADTSGTDVAAPMALMSTAATTGTVYPVTTSGPNIVGFNPAKDKLDFGDVSVHNFIVVDTPQGVGFMNPWSGDTAVVEGVSLGQLTPDNFTPVINDHLRQDLSGALAWEQGVTPAPNTVYARSHEIGQIDTVAFNPATDVVDFRYYGTREQIYMADSPQGVVISNTGTGQTLILQGVTKSQLGAKNFVFHAPQVREDRVHQQLGLGTIPDSQVLPQGVPIAGTNTWPTGTGNGTPPSGEVGTTTTINWLYGKDTTLNFDPAKDKLDFGWFKGDQFDVKETNGSTKIDILGNQQSYTLDGIALNELKTSNIIALDDTARVKWNNLINNAAPSTPVPSLSVSNGSVTEGNSGTKTVPFTVTLSAPSTEPVTVGYTTSNGTATTVGGDYTPTLGTLTFAPGQTTKVVEVPVSGDTLVEPDETFSLNLSSPANATIAKASGTGTIVNDDVDTAPNTPPKVSIADLSVTEGDGEHSHFMFVATLDKPSTEPVTVKYATSDGTATAGTDYTPTTGTITFAPGVTTQLVHVDIKGDSAVESDETFTVTLSSPTGATIGDGSAIGTIKNDDVLVPGPEVPADAWGEAYFAPYVDMAAWPVPNLSQIAQDRGTPLLTLGFIQATPDGKAAWGGLPALAIDSDNDQARAINSSIAAHKAAGGDVMVSMGGASGISLAQSYAAQGRSAQDLADAYADVVDTYDVDRIDFDIEGAAMADHQSIELHNQAVKLLQDEKPDLDVWYTLPVLPSGLTPDGLNVVRSALDKGVDLDGVNVMAMDYGDSAAPTTGPNAKTMGAYAISAAEESHHQLSALHAEYGKDFGWNQLGVTPMIGVNDVTTEVFTVADAQALEDFARAKGLGMLSMWSINRDTPGTLGQASPSASGLNLPAGSFSNVFNDYGTAVAPNTQPSVSIGDATVTEGNTGGRNAAFTVTLSQASTTPVTVNYATANGTATAGSDYTASTGTVTFAPGQTTQVVNVNVIGDSVVESDETFMVMLSNPSGARIGDAHGAGTVTNDDVSTPNPNPSTGAAAATYTTSDSWSSGFTGNIDVKAGETKLDGWTVEFDSPADITNIWNAEIVSKQNGHYVVKNAPWNGTVAPGQTTSFGFQGAGAPTVTNLKVNGVPTSNPTTPPTISIADATVTEGNSGTKNASFVATLSKASTTPVTVHYMTSNGTATAGSDYTTTMGNITFAPGVTSQTVTVPVTGDTVVEGNETFTVTLSSPSGATIADGTAVGTITNDDVATPVLPTVSLADATVTEGNSGTKNASFVATLSQASTTPVTVAYATGNGTATAGSDYTASTGTITFAPGVTSQTVNVAVVGDTAVEDNETFTVTLSNPSGATIADGSAVGTITNDDVSTPNPQPGDATAVHRVTDNWGSGFTSNVDVKAGQTKLDGWTVEFDSPADITNVWNAEIVSKQGNHYVIKNAPWNATVAPGQTTSFGFQGAGAPTVTNLKVNGVPVSNPTTPPTISIADATVAEGNSGTKNASFVATLSKASTTPVTVNYATSNGTATAGSDYTPATGTITFAPGVTSQTVNVAVLGDTAVESNETFTVTLTNPSGATIADGSAIGTITNDDSTTPSPTPGISISDASVTEPGAGTGSAGPLSTQGNQIIDANGNKVQLAGTNWFGLESDNGTPHGLWTRNYKDMIDQMDAEGFNTIRLPYSSENLHSNEPPTSINYALNPELQGMSRQEVMDEIIRYAGTKNMYVILDHHRSDNGAGASDNGLWYTDEYTEDEWVADWQMLAQRYKNSPNVIGADVHNEPHNGTWGGGGANDWARAATRAGDAIHQVNPNWLIFVEGVETYQGENYWWGGNLMGVRDRPIVLQQPGKVVYSPHDYPNSVYPQPWFQGDNFGQQLPNKYRQMWGYIYEEDIAPIYVGEFGTKLQDPKDAVWFESITSYMAGDFDNDGDIDIEAGDEDMSWTYWSWNPNSGDTGGILADDWRTINRNKMVYLTPIQSDDDAGGTGFGTTPATFAVTLAAPSDQPVTVHYVTSNGTATAGSDYTATTGSITFAPGETRKTITVPVKGDNVAEGNETFTVLLSNPTGGTIVDGSGTGTIVNRNVA